MDRISAGEDWAGALGSVRLGRAHAVPLATQRGRLWAVAVTPDGTHIMASGTEGSIRVWSRDGEPIGDPLVGHVGPVRALAVSPDGTRIISGGDDRTIRVWDRFTGELTMSPLTGHGGSLMSVMVSPDGAQIISGGDDRTIRIWDLFTGREVREPFVGHSGTVMALAISPDGAGIISTGTDGNVCVWDVESGRGTMLQGHDGFAQAVALTPDGVQIVTGGDDSTVRIWDRVTGHSVMGPLTGHAAPVLAVAVTPDGAGIVSAGDDRTVRVWDRLTGGAIGEPMAGHRSLIRAVAVTPDGAEIISAGEDGQIRAWSLDGVMSSEPGLGDQTRLSEVVSDRESVDDLLGVTRDVRTVAEMVSALSTKPPLSVALLGAWGSGKSSFMRQVRARVDELAAAASDGVSAFAINVRQVYFNAWHYSDDHLWVGLAEHLFRELTAAPTSEKIGEISDLESRLSVRQFERDRLDTDLRTVDASERTWLRAVLVPLRSTRFAWSAFKGGWRELRSSRWQVLLALLAILAGIGMLILGSELARWIGGAVALMTSAGVPILCRKLGEYTELVRRGLLARRSEVDADIQELEDKLSQLVPARRLDRLLAEISAAERYKTYRGLTGRIHEDLTRLAEDLALAKEHWEQAGGTGIPPIQRIVLYIDDLDRCAPERAVEVLQAVNMLLSTELFIVVVAVEPQALLRSLESHPKSVGEQPVEYLEKIFHIPMTLRSMGEHASGFLLSLLPPDDDPALAAPQTPPTTAPNPQPAETLRKVGSPQHLRQQTQLHVPHRRVVADLNPVGLRLRTSEREFLGTLTPLLPTPRAIKKLVNLYRMLRLGIRDRELNEFVGKDQGGPYQAAALLLAALVGSPREARLLLTDLVTAPVGQDITTCLPDSPLATRLAELIALLRKDSPVHGDTATYRQWARAVARYGFETCDLFTN